MDKHASLGTVLLLGALAAGGGVAAKKGIEYSIDRSIQKLFRKRTLVDHLRMKGLF